MSLRAAEQSLGADGAIACFSSILFPLSLNADRALQLKAGVSLLREPMREEILKQFFTGEVGSTVLAEDLVDSMITKGDMTKHPIEDMRESFQLGREHIIRLCDAILNGEIKPQYLQSTLPASVQNVSAYLRRPHVRVVSMTARWLSPGSLATVDLPKR